jgi:hypothetical protein
MGLLVEEWYKTFSPICAATFIGTYINSPEPKTRDFPPVRCFDNSLPTFSAHTDAFSFSFEVNPNLPVKRK